MQRGRYFYNKYFSKAFVFSLFFVCQDVIMAQDKVDVAFPINDFFINATEETKFLFQQYLCKGDVRTFGKFCCECADYCFRSHSCCIDQLWDRQKSLSTDDYLEMFKKENAKYPETSCQPAFPLALKKGEKSTRYFMISKCLNDASTEDVKGCANENQTESYEYMIPVFGEDNYLYKNAFCAKCNSVRKYETLNIRGFCESRVFRPVLPPPPSLPGVTTTTTTPAPQPLSETLVNCQYDIGSENVNFIFPNTLRCTEKKTRSRYNCKNRNNKYYNLCHSYYAIASSYSNYHCYLCEKEDNPNLPEPQFGCPDNSEGSGTFTWSFTLNFAEETEVTIKGPFSGPEQETYCKDGNKYNVFTGACDPFTCTVGFVKNGSSCIKIPTTESRINLEIENPSFDKCLIRNKPKIVVKINSSVPNYKTVLLNIFNNKTANIQEIHKNPDAVFLKIDYEIINLTLFFNDVIANNDNIWNEVEKIFVTKTEPYVSDILDLDLLNSFEGPRFCARLQKLQNSSSNFSGKCEINYENRNFTSYNISQLVIYERDNITRELATCEEFYHNSPCKLTFINESYTVLDNLTVIFHNKSYKPSEYIPLLAGIGICITETKYLTIATNNYSWKETTLDIEYYIGVILTPISIICYLIIIAVHLYFKEFRTIPGLTVVGLCVTLVLADITFLIASHIDDNYSACKSSAIILHWLLLATQGWVIVMAFDLLSKFGSLGKRGAARGYKSLIVYHIFVVVVTTIIVGTLVLLDELDVYKSGYASNNVCFINKLYPRIYFYIIPVSLSIIFTGVVFTRSVSAIVMQERQTREVLADSGRKKNNLIVIASKLVIVLGLVEIVGFIQIIKDSLSENEEIFNATFGLLFTLLRSVRGILLFFVYICNKQKLNAIKEHIRATAGMEKTDTIELTLSQSKI